MKSSMFKKALLVASLALPLTVMAQPSPGGGDGYGPGYPMGGERSCHRDHHKGFRDGGMKYMLRDLDLDESQRTQIKQIFEAQAPKMREEFTVMRQKRQAINQLMTADVLDEALLHDLTQQQAQMMAERSAERVRTQHAMLAILTPEQRATVQARMEKRMDAHKGFRHHPAPEGMSPDIDN